MRGWGLEATEQELRQQKAKYTFGKLTQFLYPFACLPVSGMICDAIQPGVNLKKNYLTTERIPAFLNFLAALALLRVLQKLKFTITAFAPENTVNVSLIMRITMD